MIQIPAGRRAVRASVGAVRWLGVYAAVMVVCVTTAWAQTPRRDGWGLLSEDDRHQAYLDRTVLWLHWWEANRDSYVQSALAKRGEADAAVERDSELMQRAVEALIEASRKKTGSRKNPAQLRAEAAIALGRIGGEQAVIRLIELAMDDESSVRLNAMLALGACRHPLARKFLLEAQMTNINDRTRRVAALGLLEPGDEEAIALLKKELLDLPLHPSKSIALQSLRLLRADRIEEMGYQVIFETDSVDLASEAILAMGEKPRPEHTTLLWSLLKGGRPASDLNFGRNGLSEETCFAAAYVLGRYGGMVEGEKRLPRLLSRYALRTTEDGFGDHYRGAALMSLAQVAEPEDLEVFEDALDGMTEADADRQRHRQAGTDMNKYRRRYDPIRGYAAIAMGQWLNRFVESDPVPEDERSVTPVAYPHEIDRIHRRLLRHLSQTLTADYESNDLRAAAAIGLALSEHPDALGLIVEGLEGVDHENVMVLGYGTLAMALLGDERARVPAERYFKELAEAKHVNNLTGQNVDDAVLGLRAMALTLGIVGDQGAADAMNEAWGTDPWVSLEMADALNRLGDTSIAEKLLDKLGDEPDADEAMLAVMGLGELFEAAQPSRFVRLIQGGNYAVNNLRRDRSGRQFNVTPATDRSHCVSQQGNNRLYEIPANVYMYNIMRN